VLAWQQNCGRRPRRNHLVDPASAGEIPAVHSAIRGLQAQVTGAAEEGLSATAAGITQEDVRAEL
jgi:hypothetical protein